MKILDQLSRIDQSAHELWSDYEVRLAMGALPALIRAVRAVENYRAAQWAYRESIDSYTLLEQTAKELDEALCQLREVRK